LERLINRSVKSSLKEHTPELLSAFNKSNVLFAQAASRFNNDFLRGLIAKGSPELLNPAAREAGDVVGAPELIIKELVQKGAISRIGKLQQALGVDSVAMGNIRAMGIQRLLSEGTVDGAVVGSKLLKAVQGRGTLELEGFGVKTMTKLLGGDTIEGLTKFAKALEVAQTKGPSPGGFAATLWQIGAFGSLVALDFNAAAGTVLIAPFIASRMLTSPFGRQLLAQGFRLPRTEAALPAMQALFNRMVAFNTGLDTISSNFIKESLLGEEPLTTRVETPGGAVTVRP